MLITNGFLTNSSSRHIRSLARALPPGLSTRITIALTVASSFAWRMALIIVSEPIVVSPENVSDELLPVMMGPTALIIASLELVVFRFGCSIPINKSMNFTMPVKPLKSVSSFFLPYFLVIFTFESGPPFTNDSNSSG